MYGNKIIIDDEFLIYDFLSYKISILQFEELCNINVSCYIKFMIKLKLVLKLPNYIQSSKNMVRNLR